MPQKPIKSAEQAVKDIRKARGHLPRRANPFAERLRQILKSATTPDKKG